MDSAAAKYIMDMRMTHYNYRTINNIPASKKALVCVIILMSVMLKTINVTNNQNYQENQIFEYR